MRPIDRSAEHDRRRLVRRLAEPRKATMLRRGGGLGLSATAELTGVNEVDAADLQATPWYDWRWGCRAPITIDRTKVAGALDNYVLYLSGANLPAICFEAAQTSGNDVLLTAADGVTKLAHDMPHFSRSGATLELHAKLPGTLNPTPLDVGRLLTRGAGAETDFLLPRGYGDYDGAQDNLIWLYTGNPAATDQRNASAVWTPGYLSVWHLGETSGAFTAYGTGPQAGTDSNTTRGANGKLYASGGVDFAGPYPGGTTPSWIDLTGLTSPAGSNHTYTMWLRSTQSTSPGDPHLFSVQTGRLDLAFWRIAPATGFAQYDGAWRTYSQPTPTDGAWHHIAFTRNVTGAATNAYVDSVAGAAKAITNRALGGAVRLGGYYAGGTSYDYDGLMDEFRIANGVLTAAWIATEYNNQSNPATFYSVGTPQVARS